MTDTSNLGLHKPTAGDATWDVPINQNADTLDGLFAASGGTHDHSGAAGHGQKLSQANTHQSPDTDVAPTSLHHTLGTGANQAAAGNHTHTGYATTTHASAHAAAGSDPLTLTAAQISDFAAATGASIHAAPAKTTPVDADETALIDAAASNALKRITWANVKATLKTYFDPLYAAVTHTHAAADIASGTIAPVRLGSGTADSTTILYGDSVYRPAPSGGGTGDASTNTSTSVDGEGVLFSGTGGKTLKRSTLTGLVKATAGVHSAATAGTDYYNPGGTDVAVADGGTGASSATAARTNLGLVIGTDVEAHDADLTTIAGLSPSNDDIIQRKGGAWANRTIAQLIADLAAGGLTGGTSYNPLTTARYTEEFGGSSLSSGQIGNLGWTITGGLTTAPAPVTNHPGIINRSTGTTSGTAALLYLSNAGSISLMLPSETFDCTWIVRLNSNDTNTTVRVGISTGQNPPNDGVFFEKLDADTNWFRVARNAAAQTRTDTGVAVTTGWVKCRLRRIDAGTIGYTIDANAEQTLTTNVPTAVLVPLVQIVNSAASAKTIDVDYMDLQITVTR